MRPKATSLIVRSAPLPPRIPPRIGCPQLGHLSASRLTTLPHEGQDNAKDEALLEGWLPGILFPACPDGRVRLRRDKLKPIIPRIATAIMTIGIIGVPAPGSIYAIIMRYLPFCYHVERQRSPDGALCATYGATPCSADLSL